MAPPQDFGRARRAPPTIDLEASEVSSETRDPVGDAAPESASHEPRAEEARSGETVAAESAATEPPHPTAAPISPWVIAPVSGAVAAALVIGVGWVLGWPAVQPAPVTPQVSVAAVDGIAARVAGLEQKVSKPAADPATVARIVALEKSQGSLRDELAATRAQSEKLVASSSAANSTAAPVDATAAAVDLSAINARLDQIESAVHAATAPQNAKPADDIALRRVVVASLLDLSVRQGEPFKDALSAAKSLAPDDAALNSLESFAGNGVPTAAILSRELLTLVPKLSPPPVLENDSVSPDIVDRLRAGAAKLVRIERIDAVGNDRGAIVARVTTAALRNDSNEARRELKTLPLEERTAAQSWLDKADARDAALAAARQFATDAMASLAKPAQ
ncbi:hypothetical protein [Bradyrhizobium sp. S69]|uniref:COG4223 family protein n=1 Tax=Bradyrhizobium sp. S69 TaxID=1641856 RepID=UPI001FF02EE8|nr:hypothetical protein [Bradyrhizobium sp. S69]